MKKYYYDSIQAVFQHFRQGQEHEQRANHVDVECDVEHDGKEVAICVTYATTSL